MGKEIKYSIQAMKLAQNLKTTSLKIGNSNPKIPRLLVAGNKVGRGTKTDFEKFKKFCDTFNELSSFILKIESMAQLDADDVINTMTNYSYLDNALAKSINSLGLGLGLGASVGAAISTGAANVQTAGNKAVKAAAQKAKASEIPADKFKPGTQAENMDYVAAVGKEIWEKYHIFPSVLVAQALCETGCGTNGYTVERNNWFCIAAFDSDLDAAYDFPTVKAGIEAAAKNYWSGASPEYENVIKAKTPEEQMQAICRSDWALSHYEDASGSTGGNLKSVWDSYDLAKYDEGIVNYTPDMSDYGK